MSLAPRGHIILDSIETWPASIREILASEEAELRSYVEAERTREERLRDDVMLRYQRWANPHQPGWQEAAGRVRELADAYPVVGFHCTRLIPEEIEDICAKGLCPLSPCFTRQRVDRLVRQGLISVACAEALKRRNEASASNREGRVSFFHCLSSFRDEGAIYYLLRYWGGEAVYHHHTAHSGPNEALRRIGMPCIVLAALHRSEVDTFGCFEERLIAVWLDRNSPDARSHECDTQVKDRTVPVLEVIDYADPRFEQLTGCSQWRRRIDSSP